MTGKVETGIFNLEVLGKVASLEIREASSKLTAEITLTARSPCGWKSIYRGIGDQSGKVNLAIRAAPALLDATEQAIRDKSKAH